MFEWLVLKGKCIFSGAKYIVFVYVAVVLQLCIIGSSAKLFTSIFVVLPVNDSSREIRRPRYFFVNLLEYAPL